MPAPPAPITITSKADSLRPGDTVDVLGQRASAASPVIGYGRLLLDHWYRRRCGSGIIAAGRAGVRSRWCVIVSGSFTGLRLNHIGGRDYAVHRRAGHE